MRRISGSRTAMSLLVGWLLWPTLAPAQAPKAGTVTALEGRATVARVALPTPAALRFQDDVFVRDRIETSERSVARVLLGGKAIVTIRELSVFTVTEEPGRAVVELTKGKLALGVARKLLQPGESVEIRGPNVAAAVRGSYLTFAVGTLGDPASSVVSVLEESQCIPVWVLNDPTRTACLNANEAVDALGSALALRRLSAEEARREAETGEAPRPDALQMLPPGLAPGMRREVLQLATFTPQIGRPPLFPPPPARPPCPPRHSVCRTRRRTSSLHRRHRHRRLRPRPRRGRPGSPPHPGRHRRTCPRCPSPSPSAPPAAGRKGARLQ